MSSSCAERIVCCVAVLMQNAVCKKDEMRYGDRIESGTLRFFMMWHIFWSTPWPRIQMQMHTCYHYLTVDRDADGDALHDSGTRSVPSGCLSAHGSRGCILCPRITAAGARRWVWPCGPDSEFSRSDTACKSCTQHAHFPHSSTKEGRQCNTGWHCESVSPFRHADCKTRNRCNSSDMHATVSFASPLLHHCSNRMMDSSMKHCV